MDHFDVASTEFEGEITFIFFKLYGQQTLRTILLCCYKYTIGMHGIPIKHYYALLQIAM